MRSCCCGWNVNRADLLYSVLKDGRTYSRQEIFDRVGFLMTNNAASELRQRGFNVEHKKAGGLDVYRLLDTATLPPSGGGQGLTLPASSSPGVAVSSRPTPNPAPLLGEPDGAEAPGDRDDAGLLISAGQLSLEVAA